MKVVSFSIFVILLFSFRSNCQPPGGTNLKEVTFEEFGCKGNGKDETELILKAFEFAKGQRLPIKMSGKTYIFSPTSTINITGIPAIVGSGTLDLSKTGKAAGNEQMTAIFHIEGKKEIVQRGVRTMSKGAREIQLDKNLVLSAGDVLFISSAEPLANQKREYYCKGQRAVVKKYEKITGRLELESPLFYTIQSAYIWKLIYQPSITIEKNIRFITAPMNFITCFRLYYAKGNISGYYKNFALTAVMFKSSDGVVHEMEADLPVSDNNGYSHCVEVADMSSVVIRNSKLTGGRHVISGVGGGLWEKEESGGRGHAGYPSELEVNGGIYKGMLRANNITEHNATLDSHGLVENMIIKNCTIYGGINLGANKVLVDSVTIYTNEKRILNVGSDVNENADWGEYIIQNSRFVAEERSTISLIYGKANVKSLVLKNIDVQNISGNSYLLDFRYFSPQKITIDNLRIRNKPTRPLIIGLRKGKFSIRDSDVDVETIKWIN